jgi:NitT/TauT family transport system substrate-binding protein
MVASVEGMQRETQINSVPFSMDFAFNNPVFQANGYSWDMDRVDHNIEIVGKISPLTNDLSAEDVVYNVAE